MRQYVLQLAQDTICSSCATPASLRNDVHRLVDALMRQVQHDLHKQIHTLQVKLLFAEQCVCLEAWQGGGICRCTFTSRQPFVPSCVDLQLGTRHARTLMEVKKALLCWTGKA